MQLVWSTGDLRLGGIAREGFPLLLFDSGEPLEPVFQFLVHCCLHRARAQSRKTWQAYGYSFKDFFSFLEAQGRSWSEPRIQGQPSLVADYRTWALEEKQHEVDTINARLDLIVRFYDFAHRRGWIAELPFGFEERKIGGRNDFLSHAVTPPTTKAVADVKFKASRRQLKVLSVGEVSSLMAKLQLDTGIRTEELVTFPVTYLADPHTLPHRRQYFAIALRPNEMRTKGNVERTIHVHRDVMAQLWAYRNLERAQRAAFSTSGSAALFLTEDGGPFDRKTVWSIYRGTSRATGLQIHPHMLRHTYATHMLAALAKSRNVGNALLYIRDRLGHSSVKTTEKYLHYVDAVAESIMDEYQNDLTALLAGGSTSG
jgi:integrase/recombinase XerD